MIEQMPPLVVIESPFQNKDENLSYARRCLLDTVRRGESGYASHLLMSQVLDDANDDERATGMLAGFAWGAKAETCAVYVDRGFTGGMAEGVRRACMPRRMHDCAPKISFRSLGEGPYIGAAMRLAGAYEPESGVLWLDRDMQLFARTPLAAGEQLRLEAEIFAFDRYQRTGQTARVALASAKGSAVAVGYSSGRSKLEVPNGSISKLLELCVPSDHVVALLRPAPVG